MGEEYFEQRKNYFLTDGDKELINEAIAVALNVISDNDKISVILRRYF